MEGLDGSDVDLFDAVPFPLLGDDLLLKYFDNSNLDIEDNDDSNNSKSSSVENLFLEVLIFDNLSLLYKCIIIKAEDGDRDRHEC